MKEITIKREPEMENLIIKVGDGCTIKYYSDCDPATVIEIADNGSWIKVREDNAIRTDNNGMSDFQSYEYSENPEGKIHVFKRTRKDPSLYTDNGKARDWGTHLYFGDRKKYIDYFF